MRLVAPITFAGLTALSLLIRTNLPTAWRPAACATRKVPITLLRTASRGFSSIIGTCLYAAA